MYVKTHQSGTELTADETRAAALRRLGRRESSAADLRKYLEARGVAAGVALQVVEDLVRAGYVDDLRYARMFTREQLQRGKGPAYIRHRLGQKGVLLKEHAVAELLEELTRDASGHSASELELARRVVERRYPECRAQAGRRPDRKAVARALRGLVSRGFSFEVARKAVFTNTDSEE